MSKLPTPHRSRTPAVPLVWVVPLVALAVGAWMVVRELRQRGPEITIEFADGSGLDAGKSPLEYKGVTVGKVSALQLKPDRSGVLIHLRLEREAEPLARAGSLFWIVRPEVGLSGVRSLDTLITGARLTVRPGRGPAASTFVGLAQPPPPVFPTEGRTFILACDQLGSITTGAGVYYRELKIGEVEVLRLAEDAGAVNIRIRIQAEYVDLVRANTKFWNSGGLSFHVSLLGAEVKDTSLTSLLTGGISLATPETEPLAEPAPAGARFPLAREPEKEWTRWRPRIPIHSHPGTTAPEVPEGIQGLMKH